MARAKNIPLDLRGSLTLNEAMTYAGIGHTKAKKLVRSGGWRAYPSGREIRVIKKSIDEWMEDSARGAQLT